MKTSFKKIGLCIAAVCISLACATVISCGDDGGSNNNGGDGGGGGGSNSGVVGKWVGQKGHHTYIVTVASNGTGVMLDQYNDSYSGIDTESYPFTYTMTSANDGVITMQGFDSYSGSGSYSEIVYFKIDGDKMYIYEDSSKTGLMLTLTRNGIIDNDGGDDTPNEPGPEPSSASASDASVFGTWRGVNDGEQLTLLINNNGTGTWTQSYGGQSVSGNLTYVMRGNTKGVVVAQGASSYSGSGGSNIIMSYEIRGNLMYVVSGDRNVVYQGESYDYEWILSK